MARRIGRGELEESEREHSLAQARTWAGYAIRLGVGDARERFLEMRPEAEHAADHYEFTDLTQTLTPTELREIVTAMHGKGPSFAVRSALDRADGLRTV